MEKSHSVEERKTHGQATGFEGKRCKKEKFSEWPLTDVFGICRQTILPILTAEPTFDSALVTPNYFRGMLPRPLWAMISIGSRLLTRTLGIVGTFLPKCLKENSPPLDYQTYSYQWFQIVTSPIAAIRIHGGQICIVARKQTPFFQI